MRDFFKLISTALSILLVSLGFLFIFGASGCSQPATSTINGTSTPVVPALPALDTMPHGALETAYFALG